MVWQVREYFHVKWNNNIFETGIALENSGFVVSITAMQGSIDSHLLRWLKKGYCKNILNI